MGMAVGYGNMPSEHKLAMDVAAATVVPTLVNRAKLKVESQRQVFRCKFLR